MLHARDEDFLAIDDITVASPLGECADAVGVGARGGLRDREGLNAQFARRDFRQVALLLLFRPVPQQRAHDVHLRMTRARVSSGAVDLLHNYRGFRNAKTTTAVRSGDQRGKPSGAGQSTHELLGVFRLLINGLPIRAAETAAQLAYCLAILGESLRVRINVLHPGPRRARMMSS